MTKEEKKEILKTLYSKVVDEINTITDSQAEDVRIEQIVFGDQNSINDFIISYLLKDFNIYDQKGLGSLVSKPKYERIYKKVNLINNEINGILMYKVA
jgi:hypothetical protein